MQKKQPARGTTPGGRYLQVARHRLDDSAALLKNKRYDAAVYLCGYAIECRLKYAITRLQGVANLPAENEHHSWEKLLHTAGLTRDLDAQQAIDAAFGEVADQWSPTIRYEVNRFDRSKAERFCEKSKAVYEWLRELVP